jgi:hypothetical protein
MTERSAYAEDDPRHHTAHLRELLHAVVDHARRQEGTSLAVNLARPALANGKPSL